MKKRVMSILLSVAMLLMIMTVTSIMTLAAGDSASTATEIKVGNTYNGTIAATNTIDYYKFTLSKSGALVISLNSQISNTVPYQLYDAENNRIWSTSGKTGLNKTTELTSGTYYFVVQRYSSGSEYEGAYNFCIAYASIFKDISNSAYYSQPVAWAVENNITNGTFSTTFSPNDTCTRGQIVTFLYRDLAK